MSLLNSPSCIALRTVIDMSKSSLFFWRPSIFDKGNCNIKQLTIFREHRARIFSGDIHRDSVTAVTSGHSGTRVWNMETGETLHQLDRGCFFTRFLKLTPDKFVYAGMQSSRGSQSSQGRAFIRSQAVSTLDCSNFHTNSNTKKFRTNFEPQHLLQYLSKYGKLRHMDKLGKLSSIWVVAQLSGFIHMEMTAF